MLSKSLRIAVYARSVEEGYIEEVKLFIEVLRKEHNVLFYIHSNISFLTNNHYEDQIYNAQEKIEDPIDLFITLGGDGTLLNVIRYLQNFDTPIMSINLGRLGFLTQFILSESTENIKQILNSDAKIEKKPLLEWINTTSLQNDNLALNDIIIHKKDNAILTIHIYVNEEKLNTYWADGLIVATSTGSTAYSLSCGGPIISPTLKVLAITPIAPHNLNVRPLVLEANANIKIRVEARNNHFLLTCDSRTTEIPVKNEVNIKLSKKSLSLYQPSNYSFYDVLRKKFSWGNDKRNEK